MSQTVIKEFMVQRLFPDIYPHLGRSVVHMVVRQEENDE